MPKKAERPQANPLHEAIRAMLAIAARDGWAGVDPRSVADAAGLDEGAVYGLAGDRAGLLAAWDRELDLKALADAGPPSPQLSARERLFDLLMSKFEAMNANRAAALAIAEGIRTDPAASLRMLARLGKSMEWMLDAAGVSANPLKTMALSALYAETFRTWMKDDTGDLAATMAALDRNLARAEQWAARLRCGGDQATA